MRFSFLFHLTNTSHIPPGPPNNVFLCLPVATMHRTSGHVLTWLIYTPNWHWPPTKIIKKRKKILLFMISKTQKVVPQERIIEECIIHGETGLIVHNSWCIAIILHHSRLLLATWFLSIKLSLTLSIIQNKCSFNKVLFSSMYPPFFSLTMSICHLPSAKAYR